MTEIDRLFMGRKPHLYYPDSTYKTKNMTNEEYLWAYIHWLEEWLKATSERVRDLEQKNAKLEKDRHD